MQHFVAMRYALASLREATHRARQAVDTASVMTASAQSHWQDDHTRLSAVEGLLERRADERRTERDVEVAKELDDVAGRLWLRRSRAEGA